MTNAIAAESGQPYRWFHSNHLFYPFLGVLWFKFERALGYEGYAIYSLARFNSLLMALALAKLFASLKKPCGQFMAFALVFFLGSTYAVWHYAVDGRAIGASAFFTVLVISKLLSINEQSKVSNKTTLILAVLSVLLILLHGIAALHVFPVIYWYRIRSKSWHLARLYAGAVAVGVSLAYVLAFCVITPIIPWDKFFSWALGYAAYHGSGKIFESNFWVKDLKAAMLGMWQGWEHAIVTVVPQGWGTYFSVAAAIFLLVVLAVGFLLTRDKDSKTQSLVWALIAWGGVISIFLFFWSPGQEGFRLHVLIPWVAAAALGFQAKKHISWTLMAFGAMLFTFNLNFGLFPAAFIQNNVGFQVLSEIQSKTRPNDVILVGRSDVVPGIEVLLPYFFSQLSGGTVEGRLMAFKEPNLDPLSARLLDKQKKGASLYFADDLFDTEIQAKIDANAQMALGTTARFVAKFKPEEFFSTQNGRQIYRVRAKAT